MFTSMKEYEKQLNTLNPEQKIKHNDNTMNELIIIITLIVQMPLIWLTF